MMYWIKMPFKGCPLFQSMISNLSSICETTGCQYMLEVVGSQQLKGHRLETTEFKRRSGCTFMILYRPKPYNNGDFYKTVVSIGNKQGAPGSYLFYPAEDTINYVG